MLKTFLLSTLISAVSAQSPQAATVESLLYGYPLLSWQSLYAPAIAEVGPNAFNHAERLRTPADRTVVKPNRDTIYSTVIYDLSQSDLELTVPDGPDAFKLFSFYDPYGVNFANIGGGGFFQPGRYLIRQGYDGLQIVNGSDTDYVVFVNSPTFYGTLLVRWGVDGEESVDVLREWQDRTSIEPVSRTNGAADAPSLESLVDVFDESASPAENILNLLAVFLPPGASTSEAYFEASGIANGEYRPIAGVNLTQANITAISMAQSAAADPDNRVTLNNDWSALSPDLIGIYDQNYAARTIIAITGYLALRRPYAIYPSLDTSARGAFTIAQDEALLFTFSGRPPLQEMGFWSMTAYGEDEFLIPNDEQVYSLGDRSSLRYADGSLVYASGNATQSRNGTFQILVQAADVQPPSNWTQNWLPAPAGGGVVLPLLRFFGARDALIDGEYAYPELTRIKAIAASEGDLPPLFEGGTSAILSSWCLLVIASTSALTSFYIL